MLPKVFVTHFPIQDAFLSQNGIEFLFYKGPLPCPREILEKEAKNVTGLVTSLEDQIDAEFLNDNTHLKVIANNAVGFNNIDIVCAREKNIKVGNTPDVLTEATSELALALTLNVSRNISRSLESIKNGKWGAWEPCGFLGISLQGKTVGVLGAGRIGFSYAKKMQKAFDCQIIYSSRSQSESFERYLGAKKVSLEELFKVSDIISLHCPLTDQTQNLVDAKLLNLMKESSILINTARGGVINHQDLYECLNSKKIFGAGLDVTFPEPLSKDSKLLKLDNLIITPHIGSATRQARFEMTKRILENLEAGLNDKPLPYSAC